MRKWKCVLTKYPEHFTVGKVYEENRDGLFTNNKGQMDHCKPEDFTNSTFEEVKEFTKADLKPCMVVILRSGDICRIEQLRNKLVICNSRNENSWNALRYDENLLYTGVNGSGWDIMEVYGFGDVGSVNYLFKVGRRELLYKRIEKSPAQIKLEELESKQREIADEIAKIRKGLF